MVSRRRAALIISGLAGAAAAVLVLIVTLQSGESEPFKSTGDRLPPTPSGLVIPTGPLQFYLATIVPPQGDATQPTEISIEGERFPYDPAALFQRIQGTEPGWQWRITYDDDTGAGPGSNLILDHTGKVTKQDILPWHASIFQPLLDYAGVPLVLRTDVPAPTATPTPTPPHPTKVVIQGVEVTLPPGAVIATAIPGSPGIGIVRMGQSYISFDQYGVIATHIAAEDQPTFGQLVDTIEALPWASPAGQ